jgi:hydrogenase 3 maturation protease
MRGDDAVGPEVIDALAGFAGAELIDAGSAPENHLGPIGALRPDRVLFVDACDFSAGPGEFRLFSREEADDLAYGLLSTHTMPLHLTMAMVAAETGAEVMLLGVQPETVELGAPLSEPVRAELPAVVEFCREWAASA